MINNDLLLNTQFGDYFVEFKLGMGGMASVYRALDQRASERVALKVLHAHLISDAEFVKRFQREAQIITRLQHPRIVSVKDCGEIKGVPYLAMGYMPNGSLAQRFQRELGVSLKVSASMLVEIAGALDYAHQQGVIHRDLKLDNILLNAHSQPMLCDFGIARLKDSSRLTVNRTINGTALCMSPEQAAGNRDIDYRSDLYSLAVMAYLMATGYYPFTAKDPMTVLHKHIVQFPPLPSQVNPLLPPELDAVLLKGLAKKPEDRYPSAARFADDFKRAVFTAAGQTTEIRITNPNPIKTNAPMTNGMMTIRLNDPFKTG